MKSKLYRIITADGRIKFAGTDSPSWFVSLEAVKPNLSKGDTVYEYDQNGNKLWEVFI